MLDQDPVKLTQFGTVTITEGRVLVAGFEGDNATCRDIAALAAVWAIGKLQQELMLTMERPGASNICVD